LDIATIRYGFTQRFRVPASVAYRWCTDFEPRDLELMREKGRRKIEHVSEDTIILTDSFHAGEGREQVSKRKLVRLFPARMFWTNTHISGPNKHSQFLYQITPEGRKTSKLEFLGQHVEYRSMSKADSNALAKRLREEDSSAWKLLAKAMERELVSH